MNIIFALMLIALMLMEFEKLKEKVNAQQNKRNTLVGQGEILNATFSMLCLLLEKFLLDKTGELKIKAETEDLKNRILSAEFENSSRAIIVKGLSEGKKSNDGKESKMALKSKFDKVVKTMKLSDQLKIDDIYRILPKETWFLIRNIAIFPSKSTKHGLK